jgi:hypothetical protein
MLAWKKQSWVGQLLSPQAVYGVLMKTDSMAGTSKKSGSENGSEISRRGLFQWGVLGLLARFFGTGTARAIPTRTVEGTRDSQSVVRMNQQLVDAALHYDRDAM